MSRHSRFGNATLNKIVHCPLLILFLLWAGIASAQDNYSVIVKCPVVSSQTGYMGVTSSTSGYVSKTKSSTASGGTNKSYSAATKASAWLVSNGPGNSTQATYSSVNYGLYNGPVSVWYSYKSTWVTYSTKTAGAAGVPGSGTATMTYKQSTSSIKSLGYANFNISAVPSFVTSVNGATMTLKDASATTHQFSIYGLKTIPTANNSANWAYLTNATSNGYYNYYSATGTSSYSVGMWGTGTYTFYSSGTVQSISSPSSVSSNTWSYKFFQDITSLRANNITSMGMMFSANPYTWLGFNVPSSNISLNVQYQAPWSKVLTPSVKTPTSSACATGGSYTLTASNTFSTNYVSIAPKTWTWYTATASGGPYASLGSTTGSTYTVSGLNVPGTIWYRFAEKVNMVSNSTRSNVTDYYTIKTNICSPAKIAFTCTSLATPNFSAESGVDDRSVILKWTSSPNVDHYVIRYGVEGGIGYKEINVSANGSSLITQTISNLTNGREYYFQLQAIGAADASGCQYCNAPTSITAATKFPLSPECNE